MIHISKSEKTGWFHVAHVKNGQILSTSEGFERRSSAVKNIRSHMKLYKSDEVTIQDNTGTIPKWIRMWYTTQIVVMDMKTKQYKTPYVVGK